MPNFASITLVGHLGQDTDLKYLQSGMAVANNSIAVKTGYGDREATTWYRLSVWGKQAENFNEWTAKGMPILIQGEPCLREWTDKDGATRQTLEVNVSSFRTLAHRDNGQTQATGTSHSQQAETSPTTIDDIPF